jgi:hypothetical protein
MPSPAEATLKVLFQYPVVLLPVFRFEKIQLVVVCEFIRRNDTLNTPLTESFTEAFIWKSAVAFVLFHGNMPVAFGAALSILIKLRFSTFWLPAKSVAFTVML